jgi:1-acyl-sn-glycerol-3-phosphate acyltransferase
VTAGFVHEGQCSRRVARGVRGTASAAATSTRDPPTVVYRVIAAVARPLIRSTVRLEVTGEEHLPAGGFVLCSNHLSALDPWALSLPLYPRQPRFLAKAEVFKPPFRAILDKIGLFSVAHGPDGLDPVAVAVGHVAVGRPVLIFPEATRRTTVVPGEIVRPRTGAARIALGAGVPLIPAAIHGTEHPRPRSRWRIVFGAPVPLDDLAVLPMREAAAVATRRLWERIARLEAGLLPGVEA